MEKVICVPATSKSRECPFGAADAVGNNQRSLLLPENIKNLFASAAEAITCECGCLLTVVNYTSELI